MSTSGSRLAALLALVLTFGVACQSSTASRAVRRVYALEAIDDRPVPVVVTASAVDTTTILSDTLTLDGAGHAVRVRLLRHAVLDAGVRADTFSQRLAYQITGDRIVLSFPCGGPANLCPHSEIGTITDSAMLLVPDIGPVAGPTLRYGCRQSP